MEQYLGREAPQTRVEAHPWQIERSIPDDVLDGLLHDADVIVVATDDREIQRLVGRRALALDIPAVFPGLYERNGGEIFIQRSPRWPCFMCRDGFRPVDEELRGVAANNADILKIIALANQLTLGILDTQSDYLARLMRPSAGETTSPQLFVDNGLTLARRTVPWRRPCPSCEVGPSPLRPDAVGAWQEAQRVRADAIATAAPRPVTPQVSHAATVAQATHPAARRGSTADPGELVGSGLCVAAWWFFFTEGFNGFAVIWNPAAWIPVIGWFFYAFSSR